MVEHIKANWPEWLTVPIVLQLVVMLVTCTFFIGGVSFISNQTASSLVGMSTRLDHMLAKLDDIDNKLPVLQERLARANADISDTKTNENGLEVRLRAVEQRTEIDSALMRGRH